MEKGLMSTRDQTKSEIKHVDRIFKPWVRKMDADIDYARSKVIEKGLVPPGIDPDHLTLRDMINLLAR